MKNFKIIWISLIFISLSCGQSNPESSLDSNSEHIDPNLPGPVTASDVHRYNLGPNEELLYGQIDSTAKDSVVKDTL